MLTADTPRLDSPEYFVFTLYVKDRSSASLKILERLAEICFAHLAGKYVIRLVDLETAPEKARRENIIATPTIDVILPDEVKRFVGDLRKSESIVLAIERAK